MQNFTVNFMKKLSYILYNISFVSVFCLVTSFIIHTIYLHSNHIATTESIATDLRLNLIKLIFASFFFIILISIFIINKIKNQELIHPKKLV